MNKFKIHCASQYNESRNKYYMKTIHFKSKIMLNNLQNLKFELTNNKIELDDDEEELRPKNVVR